MKRHITVLIAVLLLAVAPAAAQQEPTETPVPPGAPDDVENVVDDDVALVDKSYANGEITLEFYSATSKTITDGGRAAGRLGEWHRLDLA